MRKTKIQSEKCSLSWMFLFNWGMLISCCMVTWSYSTRFWEAQNLLGSYLIFLLLIESTGNINGHCKFTQDKLDGGCHCVCVCWKFKWRRERRSMKRALLTTRCGASKQLRGLSNQLNEFFLNAEMKTHLYI